MYNNEDIKGSATAVLRTSLPLICESIAKDTAASDFQAEECKIKLGWFHIAVALSDWNVYWLEAYLVKSTRINQKI